MATPMANSSGRFPKTALPAVAMICESQTGSQEKLALPTPSKMPATGSTETGSIMHLPTFCIREKAFLKMFISCTRAGQLWFGFHFHDENAHFFCGFGGESAFGKFAACVHA